MERASSGETERAVRAMLLGVALGVAMLVLGDRPEFARGTTDRNGSA